MGISLLKALKDNNVELNNTELMVVLTGSEEAGLRGAKAWAEAHKGEYQDVDTYVLSFDTIREAKFLQCNYRDLNGFVPADKKITALFKQAADNIGIPCSLGTVPLGATDSAGFCQGGFKAVGITAMDHNLPRYYHTRLDTPDDLDLDCLAKTLEVTVETVRLLEEEASAADTAAAT